MLDFALYIGRFQPPHYGHLQSVKYGLKLAKTVIIGIRMTSINLKNPLTVQERIECWKRLLTYFNIPLDRVKLVPVDDFNKRAKIPDDDKVIYKQCSLLDWAEEIQNKLGIRPDTTIVIANKPQIVVAFNLLGYVVFPAHRNRYRLVDVSATELRNLILKGDEKWKDMLPKPVVDFLEEIKIRERLLSLKNKEK